LISLVKDLLSATTFLLSAIAEIILVIPEKEKGMVL
jgi:hypothetical protein